MRVRALIALLCGAWFAVVLTVPAEIKAANSLAKQSKAVEAPEAGFVILDEDGKPIPVEDVDHMEPMGSIGTLTQPLSASTEVDKEGLGKKGSSKKASGAKGAGRGNSKRRVAAIIGSGLILVAAVFFVMMRRSRMRAAEDVFPAPAAPEMPQGIESQEVNSVERSAEQEGETLSSSQYQELSDEMKELEARVTYRLAEARGELEKRGDSRSSEFDTRVGELETRIVDLAEARELAAREEGGETSEEVTGRLGELEAKLEQMNELEARLAELSQPQEESGETDEALQALQTRLDEMEAQLREKLEAREQEEALLARMDEMAQRLESIEGRVSSLSDDQQLAAAKISTKSEALASRFGELEWRFGEILEKGEKSEVGEDESANLVERLDQLQAQLKSLEEAPAAQATDSTDHTATFAEHKQFIERNERVLRALAVKVSRMSEDSSEE